MFKRNSLKSFYALSIAWQLGFIIIFPIIGLMFIGFFIDKTLGTKPFFLILSLIIGIIITVYETYHLLLPLIKNKEKND